MRIASLGLQFVRFQIVGIAGGIMTYATYVALTEVLNIWYVASSMAGYCSGAWITFALNKSWTFGNQEEGAILFLQYMVLRGAFLASNAGLIYVAVQYLHMGYALAPALPMLALALPSLLTTRYIFRKKPAEITCGEAVTQLGEAT